MAKKKNNSANSALITMQKLANQTQVQLQKMVNEANKLQSEYNATESQKARDWQTQMSKTAHQMEVEDLKKAGLNPVLSTGGSGAQSYTTSSASMTPESGASALASLQGSQLGAISNMESSRIQAEATKAAAKASADAVKAAAATSAAAQMYSADTDYKKTKYRGKIDKDIAQNKQANSVFGFADKYLTKIMKSMPKYINVENVTRQSKIFQKSLKDNPARYISNYKTATSKNYKLTAQGQKEVNKILSSMNLKPTAENRRLYVRGYVYGKKSALDALQKKVPKTRSASTVRPGYR